MGVDRTYIKKQKGIIQLLLLLLILVAASVSGIVLRKDAARLLNTLLHLPTDRGIIEELQDTAQDTAKEEGIEGLNEEVPSLETPALAQEQAPKVFAPDPLRVTLEARATFSLLTREGIFEQTNFQRSMNLGQSFQLSGNTLLDRAAQRKAEDMLTNQYFAHIAPSGLGAGDLVRDAGYEFISVGENLAMGSFEDDKAVVDAWMASPGHRANILKAGFQEIGIGVARGLFEGSEVWMAVQIFGTPSSLCPLPDKNAADQIEQKKSELAQAQNSILAAQAKLIELRVQMRVLRDETQALFEEGNALIQQGNALIEKGNKASSRREAETYWAQGEALQEQGRDKIEEGQAKKNALDSLIAVHNEKVALYNDGLIPAAQSIQSALSSFITMYNGQVQAFNACVEQFK